MKIYFETRQDLRKFTSKSKKKNIKPVDCDTRSTMKTMGGSSNKNC